MTTETITELDRRSNDGIDVRLLWDREESRVFVTVDDAKTGDAFTVEVHEHEKAAEVFRHPYAYAAWQNVDTLGAAPVAA
jgi:hypothetical protein